MRSTYVARVTLKDEKYLSDVEKILNTESFSEPQLYVTSSIPIMMLVSPYKDNQGRDVRSFELTKYLIDCGLLSEDPKKQGEVTKDMANSLLKKLNGKSPRVELYRVSATDLVNEEHYFFNKHNGLEDEGPGPFIPYCKEQDIRPIIYTNPSQHLFSQG